MGGHLPRSRIKGFLLLDGLPTQATGTMCEPHLPEASWFCASKLPLNLQNLPKQSYNGQERLVGTRAWQGSFEGSELINNPTLELFLTNFRTWLYICINVYRKCRELNRLSLHPKNKVLLNSVLQNNSDHFATISLFQPKLETSNLEPKLFTNDHQ